MYAPPTGQASLLRVGYRGTVPDTQSLSTCHKRSPSDSEGGQTQWETTYRSPWLASSLKHLQLGFECNLEYSYEKRWHLPVALASQPLVSAGIPYTSPSW